MIVTTLAQTSLPPTWGHLAKHWQQLHQLCIAAPLSLLLDLHALLAGEIPEAMQALATTPSLCALRRLRWPIPSRIGFFALILHKWPGNGEWTPPQNTASVDLRQMLNEALVSGGLCLPTPPAPLLTWLAQSLDQLNDRLLTLLTALGPQAVALDPGLPLRLLPQIAGLPRLTEGQRQMLGQPLVTLEAGPAQGGGSGLDRAGLTGHGPITTLFPSQWAYPRALLQWRHANNSLLYRTRSGREPPQLRPVVIVLDTSPACWGVIEAMIRPAAHALAETLVHQQRPALLLTAGDNQVYCLNQPAERLQILTHRSEQTVDIPALLDKAQMLCRELASHHGCRALKPVIVLLTHCWWGNELDTPSSNKHQPGLRALFVQYPETTITPPFAVHCERWETLCHNQLSTVAAALGRLIG